MRDYCKDQMESCPKTIIKLKLTKAQWSKWKYLLNIGMKSEFLSQNYLSSYSKSNVHFLKKQSILTFIIPCLYLIIKETKNLQEQRISYINKRHTKKIKNKKKKTFSLQDFF